MTEPPAAAEGRGRGGKGPELCAGGTRWPSLARLRFPLGGMRKPQVRQLAHEAGLAVAAKRDSQDLCFLAGVGQRAFLARHGGHDGRPGEILDADGRRLGEHDGQHAFTVGQRRGLGSERSGAPVCARHRRAANTVTVGSREQLLTDTIAIREVTLHRPGTRIDASRSAPAAGGSPAIRSMGWTPVATNS